MVCKRCKAEVIGGWADGEGGVVCQKCVGRAARRSRILGYLDQVHEALGHTGPLEACATCEPATILEPLR